MKCCLLLMYSGAVMAAQVVGPRLTISLNESAAAIIKPGWPLLAQVSIANDSAERDLRLAPWSSAWPHAIRFAVTGPSGKLESWRFELTAEPPEPAITLPPRAHTSVFLVLATEKATSLSTGAYTVAAELEIGGSDGWNGLSRSVAARVEVKESAVLTPDEQTELTLLRAGVELLRKQRAEAERILSDYLDAHALVVPALRMMAEVLEEEGDYVRAYLYATRAVNAYSGNETGGAKRVEPPGQLLLLRSRLRQKALETIR